LLSVLFPKLVGFPEDGSNPRPHQNLIYFDLSKLAQRPLLGRQKIGPRWGLIFWQ
jgi:hypothetical protein